MKYLPLILALAISSCSTSEEKEEVEDSEDKKESEKKDQPVQKQIIGRIASVSTTGGFVLIQKYSAGKMPVNAIIQSAGPNGRNASLKPSGERVQNFFAADITNGKAQIGDAVVAYFDQQKKDDITPIEGEKNKKSEESPSKSDDSELSPEG